MPLYSFVTTHKGAVIESDELLDLPDIQAAWEEASVYAGQMLKDLDGSLSSNTEWNVQIRENGVPIRTIRIVTEER